MDSLTALLRLPGVQPAPPASRLAIHAFSEDAALPLPDEVADLYMTCDGALLSPGVLRILSLSDCLLYLNGIRRFGIPQRWGYLPLVDNNDSNPWCVCCTEPLRGYVIQVSHDDSAQIKFRGLDNFFAAMHRQLEAGGPFLDNLSGDFGDSARTTRDVETARMLIQIANEIDDLERFDALHFAITLFSDREIDEIIRLLDDRDEYVREAAIKRLHRIGNSDANRAIQKLHESVRSFAAGCVELLNNSGIRASIYDQAKLRLDDGPVWLNVDMLFGQRRDPNFNTFLLQRARALLAVKQHGETR